MPYTQSHLPVSDSIRLRTQTWTPDGPPRAVVLVTHGLGEHSGRYLHVGQALAAAGFVAVAYDLRGHGRSTGKRGYAPSFNTFLDDLAGVHAWAAGQHPGLKHFLFGHSTGGLITLAFAIRRRPAAAGVVATAPWLDLTYRPPVWKVWLAQVLRRIWPSLTLSHELDAHIPLSHDAAFLASMPDLDLTHSLIGVGLGLELLDVAADTLARAPELQLPLLVLHGEADAAVNPAGSRQFVQQAGSADKALRTYAGMYHEICNETERERVLADIIAWLAPRA